MARRRNKGEERRIAQERVERLASLAEEALRGERPERADRYADLAWRVKLRYQLPRSAIDGRICRACHAFLQPGVSARVRLTRGKRSVTCLRCGNVRRRILGTRGVAEPREPPGGARSAGARAEPAGGPDDGDEGEDEP